MKVVDDNTIVELYLYRNEAAIRQTSEKFGSAFICELSAEMEQCIPAPDDVKCRNQLRKYLEKEGYAI